MQKAQLKMNRKVRERKKVPSLIRRYYQRSEKNCKNLKRDSIEIHSQENTIEIENIMKILN